jgi:hypothetical protein
MCIYNYHYSLYMIYMTMNQFNCCEKSHSLVWSAFAPYLRV